ncbi:hypothetical protein HK099_003493 [Clydaea vesicula]|uniref:Uncharacterized protein n=1 Tax=Clydaea vesicula TaxID=447962 RepID=A0AAD5U3H4_9FUNG|nr:hypothetical protein HK099_003493 [Clydaea vesicula]
MSSSSDDEDEEKVENEGLNFQPPHSPKGFKISKTVDICLIEEKEEEKLKKKKTVFTKLERQEREILHRIHLLYLLAFSYKRNLNANNILLQHLTFSLIPKNLIHVNFGQKKNLQLLIELWKRKFKIFERDGQATHELINGDITTSFQKVLGGDADNTEKFNDFLSKEVYVLSFLALLRSLKLNAKLISSLHPIPLLMGGLARKPRKLSVRNEDEKNNVELFERDTPDTPFPITFWLEVYSEPLKCWFTLCPLRNIISNAQDKSFMAPKATEIPQFQYSYIISFEESGNGTDITKRYSTLYSNTLKNRLQDEEFLRNLFFHFTKSREKLTKEDKTELEELKKAYLIEKMPQSLKDFKNHPLYVLERHLAKNECLYSVDGSEKRVLGIIRDENVYSRKLVQQLKSQSSWLREGMQIKEGEEPYRYGKTNPATIRRKREIEAAQNDTRKGNVVEELGEDADPNATALWGEWQVEKCSPKPIIDGIIPKNQFGYFELLHINQLPPNASHIKLDGIAAIAKKLGIAYESALVGFEFNKGHSRPVLKGIVVESANEKILLDAYHEVDQLKMQQLKVKAQSRILNNWKKLIVMALNKKKLFEEYLPDVDESDEHKPVSSSHLSFNSISNLFNSSNSKYLDTLKEECDGKSSTQDVDSEQELNEDEENQKICNNLKRRVNLKNDNKFKKIKKILDDDDEI